MGDFTNTELEQIAQLAQLQKELIKHLSNLETQVDEAKERLRKVQEGLLPEAMLAIGMTEFKLEDGTKITIKEDVYASIRKDFVIQAVNWLDGIGLGDIVKNDVVVKFGRGDKTKASDLVSYAQAQGYNVSEKQTVHPQTLKATVREQLANGVEFPEEYFSINPVNKATVK